MARYGTVQSESVLAPQIKITVTHPADPKRTFELTAIADTGAAKTCLPTSALDDLGEEGLEYRMSAARGAYGRRRKIKCYMLRISFLECAYTLEVGVIDRKYAIIGRDILNQHRITFETDEKWTFHANA
jgi:hypothetical protein